MMNSLRYHAILSDIHRLLGTYSADEFTEAAKANQGYSDLLLKLAERASSPLSPIEVATAKAFAPLRKSLSSSSGPDSPDEIEEILRRSGKVETTAQMDSIRKAFDLRVILSPRDSRSRNIRKLAKAIAYSPQKLRQQILNVIGDPEKSETAGWLDVIRGRR